MNQFEIEMFFVYVGLEPPEAMEGKNLQVTFCTFESGGSQWCLLGRSDALSGGWAEMISFQHDTNVIWEQPLEANKTVQGES